MYLPNITQLKNPAIQPHGTHPIMSKKRENQEKSKKCVYNANVVLRVEWD